VCLVQPGQLRPLPGASRTCGGIRHTRASVYPYRGAAAQDETTIGARATSGFELCGSASGRQPRTRQGQPKSYISAQRDVMHLKGVPHREGDRAGGRFEGRTAQSTAVCRLF